MSFRAAWTLLCAASSFVTTRCAKRTCSPKSATFRPRRHHGVFRSHRPADVILALLRPAQRSLRKAGRDPQAGENDKQASFSDHVLTPSSCLNQSQIPTAWDQPTAQHAASSYHDHCGPMELAAVWLPNLPVAGPTDLGIWSAPNILFAASRGGPSLKRDNSRVITSNWQAIDT